MARRMFPCDVVAQSDRQDKRQSEREIPCEDVEALLPPVTPDELPVGLDLILAEVDRVHPRAKGWVLSKLDGLTDVEIAKEWDTTPVYVNRWFATYGRAVRRVFGRHLDLPAAPEEKLSPTRLRLMNGCRGAA